ncbi:MAG: homoserine kinase [Candidatus Methanofastidiosia archaeon]
MKKTYAKIKSPATVANFGPGFDVFGVALEAPCDIIEVEICEDESSIEVINYDLPTEIDKNVASFAAKFLFEKRGIVTNFKMTVEKGIRPASGMGSSGASSVGGAFAAAALLGKVNDQDIIFAAVEGERLSSGNPHGDNVVPSYFGGFTSIVSLYPLNVVRIYPEGLNIVVVLPDVNVSTKDARGVLPGKVPIEDAVANVSKASYLIYSLMKKEYQNLGTALNDRLSVPYRKKLVPGYEEAEKAALDSGAIGFSISGSGPAVFAIVDENANEVADAIGEVFFNRGIKCDYFTSKVGKGSQILALE